MSYTPKVWADYPAGGTPIMAADLNHLETQYAQALTDFGGTSEDGGQKLLRKLDALQSTTWLNIGDSLSDATTDWSYLLALHAGEMWPTHNVSWQTANAAGWVGSATTIKTGTGAVTLAVKNAAVGGYDSPTWTTAINAGNLDGIAPDLVTVFISHNDSNEQVTFKANFSALLNAIQTKWPTAPVVVGVQNQSTTQPEYTHNHRQWIIDVTRGRAGVTVHDNVWAAFGGTTPVAAYYVDNVHPTTAGTKALLNAWATALGIPGEAMVQLVDSSIAPVSAQIAAVVSALSAYMNPLSMLPWTVAYWAGDPGWTPPANGAKVSSWRDGSGHGVDVVQATSAEQPVYRASTAAFNNKPTIEFDPANSQSLYSALSSLAQPFSLVVVGMVDTIATSQAFADLTASGASNVYYYGLSTTAGVLWQMNLGTAIRGGAPVAGVPLMFSARANGATSSIDIDNATVVTGNTGTGAAAEVRLGRSSTGAAHTAPLDGHLAFVGIMPGDCKANVNWTLFTTWVASHYAITMDA